MKWLPISSAPKDGTEVLVIEWIGTDRPFVCVAAWICHDQPHAEPGWWAATPVSHYGAEIPHRWKEIKITPACWLPFPEMESDSTIQRRYGQIMRRDE